LCVAGIRSACDGMRERSAWIAAPIIDFHPAADACMRDTVLNRAN
jgi:hypothetical protein